MATAAAHLAVTPASAARGSVVTITISGCSLSAAEPGLGLYFHDSANLAAPSGQREAGLFTIPFAGPDDVVAWTVPAGASPGMGELFAVCYANAAYVKLLVR